MEDPRPLSLLYSSPRQLLRKAEQDLARLREATWELRQEDCRDAMFDACVAVYHVKDWIAAMHSAGAGQMAEEFVNKSPWILLCRDLCIASKHVGLRLVRGPFRKVPPVADQVAVTRSAAQGVFPTLKVFSEKYGDYDADDVIARAIEEWQRFLDREQIA